MEEQIYYRLLKIKDKTSNGSASLLRNLESSLNNLPSDVKLEHYGSFFGALGMATNEVYFLVYSKQPDLQLKAHLSSPDIEVLEERNFIPTVRPLEHSARSKEGVYVFRWFDVFRKDVTEIADLSKQAWETFESDFDSEIQALFAEAEETNTDINGEDEPIKMLLITWYKNFTVWENSRTPSPEAKKNFTRRHALTLEALPIATHLYKSS